MNNTPRRDRRFILARAHNLAPNCHWFYVAPRYIWTVTEIRDSIYYAQLARQARRAATAHSDPVVARHLREAAIKHDRHARKLARAEAEEKRTAQKPKRIFSIF